MPRYKLITSLADLKKIIKQIDLNSQICYGMSTCWWCLLKDHPGYRQGELPCDPRGGMLLQAPAAKFIENAEANSHHYGKYGLRTFEAAYHGNVTTEEGLPTCFQTWKEYEELLDD